MMELSQPNNPMSAALQLPTLPLRKLRQGEVGHLTPGHTADKKQGSQAHVFPYSPSYGSTLAWNVTYMLGQ